MAQKANYLFFTDKCAWPKRILSLTFKTEAQANIKERIYKRCGNKATRFDSFTFHAFSKSIVDRFKNIIPEIDRPIDNYDIVFKRQDANGTNKIFIDNLLTLAIKILQARDDIRKMFSSSYSYVFVDEFQDTTDKQYKLLHLLFQNTTTKVLIVGDINQSIMLWAGARRTIFADFKKDFLAECKFLVKNYRASKEIQNVLEIILEFMQTSKAVMPEIPTPPQNCSFHVFTDEHQEASYIAHNINKTISNGICPNNICVLTRQNSAKYTEVLRAELTKVGINNLDMSDLQDALKEPLGQLFSLFLKALICPTPKIMTKLFDINLDLNKVEFGDDKEEELTTFIIQFISDQQTLITTETTVDELLFYIKSFIRRLGEKKIKGRWKQYKAIEYYNIIWQKLEIHLRTMCSQTGSLEEAVKLFSAENAVHLMNIHKCKGLEYHSVYFIGLEDQAFWDYNEQCFENNCAIYVALSRAKNRINITYSKYRAHRKNTRQYDNRPSTFKAVKPVINLLIKNCKFSLENHT